MQLDLEAFARETKLVMSSVSVATLMSTLFEKRMDGWLRAQSQGQELADYLLDTAVNDTETEDELPVFLPVGTSETTDPLEQLDTGVHERHEPTPVPARRTRPVARSTTQPVRVKGPSVLWLAGVAVAAAGILGTTLAERNLPAAPDREIFEADAKRLAASLDDTARSLQLRLDGIAVAPMLRAAIETDTATITDLAANEKILSPNPGETVELFQVRDGKATSLFRRPVTAGPLELAPGRTTLLKSDGKSLIAIATAPIAGYKPGLDGGFALAVPVDLSFARTTLTDHATSATLIGLGPDLVLVPATTGKGDRIEVPIPGGRGRLAVTPIVVASGWIDPLRYGSAALAAIFLGIYVAGLRRSRVGS
jgi:hypothetical protein